MKEAGTDPAGEIETVVKTHPELLDVKEYLNPEADHDTEPGARLIMRTDALVKWICGERLAGADTEKLAYLFHGILAYQIADLCGRIIRTEEHLDGAALTGGVYQNTLLLALTEMYLREMDVTVYRHRLIPPNDGGICLGQAVYAMRILNK
jgi:hydrogenase maturation protein HypF